MGDVDQVQANFEDRDGLLVALPTPGPDDQTPEEAERARKAAATFAEMKRKAKERGDIQ